MLESPVRATAEDLLPQVYGELRQLAAAHLRRQHSGQTLQPTALVREAYLRMLDEAGGQSVPWDNAGHFYAAAAEAMRRLLIERARRKMRGGSQLQRVEMEDSFTLTWNSDPRAVLAVDEAMRKLASLDPRLHDLVRLRCFIGLSLEEAARALGVSSRTLNRDWLVAKAWLRREFADGSRVMSGSAC